jgi:hypothetical protein
MRTNTRESRNTLDPIPCNFLDYLTVDQEVALGSLRAFGWELKFIRRAPFKECVAVLINTGSDAFSVLEKDGHINFAPALALRGEFVNHQE